jgi:spore coat protein U-like protein
MAGASVLLVAAAIGSAALAQESATLNVTAQVQASCILQGGSLNFGPYTTTDASDTEGQGSFSYQCPDGTEITLSLGSGLNQEGESRAMADGAGRLLYEIYQDSNRSQEWGTGGNAVIVTSDTASETTVPVYGLIPQGQSVPAGSYSDTVQITLDIN